MTASAFNPTSIPDQSGRVFFITGGTAGLGAGSMKLIASAHAAKIFFSGRNATRANEQRQTLAQEFPQTKFEFIQCDQTDLASVKAAAESFLAQSDRLDVLMCNAGVMALPANTTQDGHELQFGINHLSHALLIQLLLPILERTAAQPSADVRIVNLTSQAYQQAPRSGFEFESLHSAQAKLGGFIPGPQWSRYGQSKLANLVYAKALAQRYPHITTVSIHPGYIATDLLANCSFVDRQIVKLAGWGKFISVEEGPYNQTWAATTAKEHLEGGAYYEPVGTKTVPTTKQANNAALVDKLWEWTQGELTSFL